MTNSGPSDALDLLKDAIGLHQSGDVAGALALYDRVIAADPDNSSAHNNRSAALSALGRFSEAAEGYATVARLMPAYPGALLHRGNALCQIGRQAEGIECYRAVLALDPANADANNNMANAQSDLGRSADAIESYGRALALRPDYPGAAGARQHLKMHICDWSGFDEALAELGALIQRGVFATTLLPLTALIDDPALHLRCAQMNIGSQTKRTTAFDHARGDRIRLGYYSRDYLTHPVAQLIAEVFERHDRSRFEVIAFSFGPDKPDAWRQRIADGVDQFIDINSQSDAEVAALSRRMGIDIAVDLAGFTRRRRAAIFIHGAAPVQVNYLGYPGTMGSSAFDYIIGDGVVTPPGDEAYYSERIVRLPDAYQANRGYEPPTDPPPSRGAHGLPDGAVVYACFNSAYKITPPVFDRWMAILRAVENSVLWLLVGNPDARANLRREAKARGVDPGRVIFADTVPLKTHLDRLRLADLFLDTAPYNAHTTASDALRMGLPLLTCPGRSFASRVGASLLTAAGLPELIGPSFDAYEAIAVALGRDPERRAQLRAKLAGLLPTCALFDAAAFTRNIEAAYLAMHARRQAGEAPAPLDIASLAP